MERVRKAWLALGISSTAGWDSGVGLRGGTARQAAAPLVEFPGLEERVDSRCETVAGVVNVGIEDFLWHLPAGKRSPWLRQSHPVGIRGRRSQQRRRR